MKSIGEVLSSLRTQFLCTHELDFEAQEQNCRSGAKMIILGNFVFFSKKVFLSTYKLPLGFLVTKATKKVSINFFLDEMQYFLFNFQPPDSIISRISGTCRFSSSISQFVFCGWIDDTPHQSLLSVSTHPEPT